MGTLNLFLPVYIKLEKEVHSLANVIFFCDKQIGVYSVNSAELLVRIAMEVESISKELYERHGGLMEPINKEGKKRDLYFDTDCLNHLEKIWLLGKKEVLVTATNFYFSEPANIILNPLKNAHKRGKSKWKKAYQSVKHNRVKDLHQATIGNIINALAALYVLNIYYVYSKKVSIESEDLSFGSSIFSVTKGDSLQDVLLSHHITCCDEININQRIRHYEYDNEGYPVYGTAVTSYHEEVGEYESMVANEYQVVQHDRTPIINVQEESEE